MDHEHGGFHGYISDEGVADPLAPKGGVLCARILWTYSGALRRPGEEAHRRMADRAYAYLRDRFSDPEHGGTYWMLDHAGRPLADRKQTYALAFSLYALAEYHRATGRGDALDAPSPSTGRSRTTPRIPGTAGTGRPARGTGARSRTCASATRT